MINGGSMLKFVEKIDNIFTARRKGFIALGAVIAAALMIAAAIFYPMECFSLFIDSTVGSYIALALISAILSCIFGWVFTLITRQALSASLLFVSNLIFQIGIFFLFSAFRYSMPYLWIIAAAVHALVTILIFLISKPSPAPSVKRTKEKPPVGTRFKIITAIIYSIAADILYNTLSFAWCIFVAR